DGGYAEGDTGLRPGGARRDVRYARRGGGRGHGRADGMLRDPPGRRRRRGSPPDPRPAGPPEGGQGDCRRRRYGGRPAERRGGPREGPGDRRADLGWIRGELRWAGGAARHDELVRARGRGREHRQRLRGRLPGQHDEPLNSIRSEHAHVDQGESDRDEPQIDGLIPDGHGNPGGAWRSIEESDGGGEDEREYEAARVVPELGPEAVALSDDLVHDLMETHAGADGEKRSWEENGEEDRRTPGESHQ